MSPRIKEIQGILVTRVRELNKLFQRPVVIIGIVILVVVICSAIFAEYLTPHDPRISNVRARLQPPSPEYLLGTDHLGRDVFSQVIYGARISLFIGFVSATLALILGLLVGMLAGYFPTADQILMRIVDGMMAFPTILLAIALMAALGPNIGNIIIALSIVYGPRIARLVRSTVLTIKETSYVEAARATGASTPRILVRHILPNSISPIIVQGTFTFGRAILSEAALTFLGVGVSPDVPTWGTLLNESRAYMQRAPWMTIPPGIAIMSVVLGLNLIGDGLRDFLDPRLKNLLGRRE